MSKTKAETKTLLKRTLLKIPFEEFLLKLEKIYSSVGNFRDHKPITEGYEDANFLLTTNKGKFVLKIFLWERTERSIKDYIKILLEAQKIGVPVVKLIKGTQGYLNNISYQKGKNYFYLSEYFEGDNFEKKPPTLSEMIKVTAYLARLNTLQFPVEATYDSWGNKNLLREFELNKNKISTEESELLLPAVDNLSNLHFEEFKKSVIHGDMQRKHVLKNKNGKFCILDLGCASYDGKVFDLSTYLAWFCLDLKNWDNKKRIYTGVIEEYKKYHKLTDYELNAISILTQASYASYYLKTSILLKEGDKSQETINWHNSAENMLKKFKK